MKYFGSFTDFMPRVSVDAILAALAARKIFLRSKYLGSQALNEVTAKNLSEPHSGYSGIFSTGQWHGGIKMVAMMKKRAATKGYFIIGSSRKGEEYLQIFRGPWFPPRYDLTH